jgi:hypothetical protein
MKSQTYKLLFLTFLLVNGSIYYATLLKGEVLNRYSKRIVPNAYVQSFGAEVSERIACKSTYTLPRCGFFKFNDKQVIIHVKIIRNLIPLFSS